LTDLRFSTTFC